MTRWRAASLIGVHVLIALHFAHWKIAGRTLAPVEPSEMFDTLHLGVITVGFLFMAAIVLATSFAGRFFCSWGCHILALQDLCAAILKRLKIPTKPIRSRTLLWAPTLAVLYLFVWPQVQRFWLGYERPALHVVTDPNGWTSFTTTDLLRSFPGLGMTLFTFAVCGFAIVYFLGSRSFCTYACPYGAIFAAAERLAPLRIIDGAGECSHCGLCVSSCKSSIQVVTEVQKFGTVMSPNCMRDLDCVSVCPTDALRLGITKPPLFRSWRNPRGLKKKYDFSWGEDLAMAAVFIALLPLVRGLYDAVSFLLALAVCAILAYVAVVAWRLLRREQVHFSSINLKRGGKLTPGGRNFAALAAALGLFVVHSAYVRYHAVAGELALVKVADKAGMVLPAATSGDGASDSDDDESEMPALQTSARAAALYHLQRAHRWGLVQPASLTRRLASAYAMNGADGEARSCLQLQLASEPDDLESRLMLGHSWSQAGRAELAKKHLQMVVQQGEQGARPSRSLYERRILTSAHCLLGDVAAQLGERQDAIDHFRRALDENPKSVDACLGLGAMLAADEQLDEAVRVFERCAAAHPDAAAVHNNLGALLTRLDRQEEALSHYRRAAALMPAHPWTHTNLGSLLATMESWDDAEQAFRRALELDPSSKEAQEGLDRVEQRR